MKGNSCQLLPLGGKIDTQKKTTKLLLKKLKLNLMYNII